MPRPKHVSDADAEGIYTLAYGEFSNGRYESSLRQFQLLLLLRPTHRVYLLGAALCLQRLGRYVLAMAAYAALCFLAPEEPAHALAMAECQILLHEHAQACETLAQVVGACAGDARHEQVRARAQAMLDLMRPRHEPVEA
jgi:type III secretion system low calcium response chaperone LcrH/SycD